MKPFENLVKATDTLLKEDMYNIERNLRTSVVELCHPFLNSNVQSSWVKTRCHKGQEPGTAYWASHFHALTSQLPYFHGQC